MRAAIGAGIPLCSGPAPVIHGENDVTLINAVRLNINQIPYELDIGDKPGQVAPWHTLVHTIRETLGLTGTKASCGQGACGACTVIMDGKAVLSCCLLTVECTGSRILTIEGLRDPKTGELDPIQRAFIEHSAFQCGYCTPGIIMTAKVLLDRTPRPSESEVLEGLSGHFCRCVSHYGVLKAVISVAESGGRNR